MDIPFNQQWDYSARYEQEMRAPHMLTKFANNAKRKAGQIRGLIIEHHVSGWFKANYPNSYENPDNHEKWTQWCSHDFKLTINNNILNIDVTGPRADGSFGSYSQKPKNGVDYHIMCHPIGFESWDKVDYSRGFKVLGVVKAEDYKKTIDRSKVIPINNWLKQIGL